jgi:hypothetical protein
MLRVKALDKIKRTFLRDEVSWDDNIYQPKIKSTYTPEKASYNEVFEHIHNQLKPKQ